MCINCGPAFGCLPECPGYDPDDQDDGLLRGLAGDEPAVSQLGAAEQAAWDVAVQRGLHLGGRPLYKTDVVAMVAAAMGTLGPFAHAIGPAPDLELNPVFDRHGREAGPADTTPGLYPLTGTCGCCRPIMKIAPGQPWGHCG